MPAQLTPRSKRNREHRRVFCASMADVFEAREDLIAPRLRLFALILDTPWLDWLLLTKRPQNARGIGDVWGGSSEWPKNVWLGTTVEDQKRADELERSIALAEEEVKLQDIRQRDVQRALASAKNFAQTLRERLAQIGKMA